MPASTVITPRRPSERTVVASSVPIWMNESPPPRLCCRHGLAAREAGDEGEGGEQGEAAIHGRQHRALGLTVPSIVAG